MLIVSSPLFVQLMNTNYYKIVKQLKSFKIIIVAATCFGLHKPSSGKMGGFLMSQNTTKFARCFYFKLSTCFDPCFGPSSGHKGICSRKLYSISHKIYQSKIQ